MDVIYFNKKNGHLKVSKKWDEHIARFDLMFLFFLHLLDLNAVGSGCQFHW